MNRWMVPRKSNFVMATSLVSLKKKKKTPNLDALRTEQNAFMSDWDTRGWLCR